MPSKRLLPTALAAAACAVAVLIPGMSSASAAAVDHDECVESANHYCIAPHVAATGDQCPGTQYFPANDAYGVPMHWTYSNDTVACVRVDYSYDISIRSQKSCQYWFYVPAGHATAPVVFGYWTRPWSIKHTVRLDENAHEGWTHVFDAAEVFDIQFQDNNGTNAGAIGWGDGSRYGWSVWC
ncbi:hypothetical protein NE236_36710 [Actinoallomurus purpureus]|uniref:hypothetical protein n=1 Tax=Actinoallomurus purpureus TaxID=478114 RepID=UPI00209298E6|nr:hypothetical protein [Actinoallomurus purpureus]MCO6010516.1 hypothetical protein [Actinoallomurus purpureus]